MGSVRPAAGTVEAPAAIDAALTRGPVEQRVRCSNPGAPPKTEPKTAVCQSRPPTRSASCLVAPRARYRGEPVRDEPPPRIKLAPTVSSGPDDRKPTPSAHRGQHGAQTPTPPTKPNPHRPRRPEGERDRTNPCERCRSRPSWARTDGVHGSQARSCITRVLAGNGIDCARGRLHKLLVLQDGMKQLLNHRDAVRQRRRRN